MLNSGSLAYFVFPSIVVLFGMLDRLGAVQGRPVQPFGLRLADGEPYAGRNSRVNSLDTSLRTHLVLGTLGLGISHRPSRGLRLCPSN